MTGPIATTQDEPFDVDVYKHQLLLLKSAHCARPVVYQGLHQFIHGLSLNLTGSEPLMMVYLGGIKDGIDSREIGIREAQTEGRNIAKEGEEGSKA